MKGRIRNWFREQRREMKFLREHRKEYRQGIQLEIVREVALIITIGTLAFLSGASSHRYGLELPTIIIFGILSAFFVLYIWVIIDDSKHIKVHIEEMKKKHHYNTNH